MKLKRLEIEGFRSYSSERVVTFEANGGMFLIRGENGVGKSSIPDALTWCLYGKTTRGLRGPSLINWEGDFLCRVKATFDSEHGKIVVLRTQSPNALSVAVGKKPPTVYTQDQVDALFRMSWSVFRVTTMVPQFGPLFLDMSGTEKLALLSTALDLDSWLERATQAKEDTAKLSGDLLDKNNQRSKLEGKRSEMLHTIGEAKKTLASRKRQEEEEAKQLRRKVKGDSKELEKAFRLEKEAAKLSDQEASILREVLEDKSRVEEEHDERQAAVETSTYEIKTTGEALDRVKDLINGCPTCGSELEEDQHALLLEEAEQAFEKARKKNRVRRSKASKLWTEVLKLREEEKAAREAARVAVDALRAREVERRALERQKAREAAPESAGASQRTREARKALSRARGRLATLEDDLAVLEEGTALLERERDTTSYWAAGFRDLRLWALDGALSELGALSGGYLASLGLEGWRLDFATERKGASGKTISGLSVLVVPEDGEEPIPFESFSGGETQRLRLAASLGLIDLVSARRGTGIGVEFFDEPTAFLSAKGVADVVSVLAERAKDSTREVWLVDHRVHANAHFDGEIEVVADPTGAKLKRPLFYDR